MAPSNGIMIAEAEKSVRIVAGPNGNGGIMEGRRSCGGIDPITKDTDSIDFSFSSYLRPEVPSKENPTPTVSAKALQRQNSKGRRIPSIFGRQAKDSELSVFEAERYFSAENLCKTPQKLKIGLEELNPSPRRPISAPVEVTRGLKSMSFRAPSCGISTPTTTCSEVSSCNSHSMLLSRSANRVTVSSVSKKRTRKRGFGCRCPCSGTKSVEIEEDNITQSRRPASTSVSIQSSPSAQYRFTGRKWAMDIVRNGTEASINNNTVPARITRSSLEKQEAFSFPVLSTQKILKSAQNSQSPALEVFGSPLHKSAATPRQSSELHRSLTLLGLEKARKSFTFTASAAPATDFDRCRNSAPSTDTRTRPDADAESDSSSDLFEIESFSTQSYPVFQGSVPFDDVCSSGSVNAGFNRPYAEDNGHHLGSIEEQSSFYEPSEAEASVDWSTTTVTTNCGTLPEKKPQNLLESRRNTVQAPNNKAIRASRLSCKGEKSVRIAESSHIAIPSYRSRSRSFDLSENGSGMVSRYEGSAVRSVLEVLPATGRPVSVGRSALI